MDGLDENWSKPSFAKSINYTNLSSGDYTLHLKALDYSTDTILDNKNIEITVLPPFYNTIWAKLIYILLAISLIRWVFVYLQIKIKKKNSEEKINFFTNTAHDIRTPLTLVSAPLNELKREDGLSEKGKYYLNLSVNNLDKLNALVCQLLDFQKSDLDKSQLVVSKVEMADLIQRKVLNFKTLAERKNIILDFSSNVKELEEYIDMAKMDKIIENLFSNAIKYTPNNGTVHVSLLADKKTWSIVVKDSGIGISKKAQENLFKQFYRGENAINSKVQGSGIGLLLVKNYVALHKGKIQFESEEDKGSEFKIVLKHCKTQFGKEVAFIESKTHKEIKVEHMDINSDSVQKIDSAPQKLSKILIAEDNDELRNYLFTSLSEYYNVSVAENGKVALDDITKVKPEMKAAIKLQAILVNRIGELCLARWEHFDFKNKTWFVPAENTKQGVEHLRPLPDQAVEIILSLKQYTLGEGFVLGGLMANNITATLRRWQQLGRLDLGEQFCVHDLRRTAATLLGKNYQVQPHIIKSLLSHTDTSAFNNYNHNDYLSERREALQQYAEMVF